MLFPAIQSWLVGDGRPLDKLYFGSLAEKNAAGEPIAVAVTESSGGEPEKHIGRHDFGPEPREIGIAHDGGILYYRTLLEFTARAADRKDVLRAALTLERVRDRMMVLANSEIFERRGLLGHHTQEGLYRRRLQGYIVAKDPHPARGWEQLGGDLLHQGGLAGPVGTEDTQHLPGESLEGDPPVGPSAVSILFVEVLDHQGYGSSSGLGPVEIRPVLAIHAGA